MLTIIAHMLSDVGVTRRTMQDFDRRNIHPAIPLNDGTALDLSQFPPAILPPEQARGLMMLDHEWSIPPPDFSLLDKSQDFAMSAAIQDRYGTELMQRCAVYLLGVSKAIDSITMPSNAGKSTLAEMLKESLPGAVSIHNASGVFHNEGSRFTPLATAVASSLITFIDEAGHDSISILTSTVNELAQNTVDEEKKGQQRRSVNRISSIMFMGHDWPHIVFSDQGIASRFIWAQDLREMKEMSSAERAELMTKENIEYLRAWLFYTAAYLFNEFGSGEEARQEQQKTDSVKSAVESMMKSRMDPVCVALTSYLAVDPYAFTESEYIKSIFEKEDLPVPQKRGLGKALRRAFHNANIYPEKSAGARGWRGLKKIHKDDE